MEIKWVPISELKPDPRNTNEHDEDQIKDLAKSISYQGWRWPIIVSNQSGLVKAGHGRLAAAKLLKLETVPVSFQDFIDEDQERAFGTSDNALGQRAEINLKKVNEDIPLFGPEFDVSLLGLNDFVIDLSMKEEKPKKKKEVTCPGCGLVF